MAPPPSSSKPARLLLALAALVVVLGAVAFWPGTESTIRLGLDLQGGTQVILKPTPVTEGESITEEQLQQTVSIIRQRVDGLGVAEAEVTTQGSGDGAVIVVSVPGVNQDRVVDLVQRTALLDFRPVWGLYSPIATAEAPASPSPSPSPSPEASAGATPSASPAASAEREPGAVGECVPVGHPDGGAPHPGRQQHPGVPGADRGTGLHRPDQLHRRSPRQPRQVARHLRCQRRGEVQPRAGLHPGHQRDRGRCRAAAERRRLGRVPELRLRGRQGARGGLDPPHLAARVRDGGRQPLQRLRHRARRRRHVGAPLQRADPRRHSPDRGQLHRPGGARTSPTS